MVESDNSDCSSQFQTSTDICNHFNSNSDFIKFSPREVGKVLRRLGYSRSQKKVNGKPLYGYWVKYLDGINPSNNDSNKFYNPLKKEYQLNFN